MKWDIAYTEEFDTWWRSLTEPAKISIDAVMHLLEELGPHLPFPHSSSISGSSVSKMRELRIQHRGKPFRVLYAFDPTRTAILLLGGCKEGDKRWYKKMVPVAEKLFKKHLEDLKKKGGKHG